MLNLVVYNCFGLEYMEKRSNKCYFVRRGKLDVSEMIYVLIGIVNMYFILLFSRRRWVIEK